tara:strand:+ start:429 stop:587 length:159 start_codon:yes stop_codon:yes gene_type:complete
MKIRNGKVINFNKLITRQDLIEEYRNRYDSELFTEETSQQIRLRLINDYENE